MSLQLVGEPTRRKNKEIFEAVELTRPEDQQRGKPSTVLVEVGDPILVHAGDNVEPYIALLTKLYRDTTRDESLMKCRWFYRATDIPDKTRKLRKIKNKELLLSNVEDINPLESLKDIANVTFIGTDQTVDRKENVNSPQISRFVCKRMYMPKTTKIRPLVIAEIPTIDSSQRYREPSKTKEQDSTSSTMIQEVTSTNQNSTKKRAREDDSMVIKASSWKAHKRDTGFVGTNKEQKMPKSCSYNNGNRSEDVSTRAGDEQNIGQPHPQENLIPAGASSTIAQSSDHDEPGDEVAYTFRDADESIQNQSVAEDSLSADNTKPTKTGRSFYRPGESNDDSEIASLAEITGQIPSDSNSKPEQISDPTESNVPLPENMEATSAKVPLRRDILIRNKEKPRIRMQMSKSDTRTSSRVGEEYQACIPPLTGVSTTVLIKDTKCAWSPFGDSTSRAIDKETVNRYLESVAQIIHFVYVGIRVGAYHPLKSRYFPGVIVAIRVPPSVTTRSNEFCRNDYSLFPGTVVDVLFNDGNECVRLDARDVQLESTFRSVSEEAALDILKSHDHDVGSALTDVQKIHSAHVSKHAFIPHMDGTHGPSPLGMLKYKPPQIRPGTSGVATKSGPDQERVSPVQSDSESTSSIQSVKECSNTPTCTLSDKECEPDEDITRQMILRALLALPPGWSTKEKHSYALGFNRYGKSFHRIHSLMCQRHGWEESPCKRIPRVPFENPEGKNRVLPSRDTYHRINEVKTVQDLVWFYYNTKYRRRFIDAPFIHDPDSSIKDPLNYYSRIRGGFPSVAAYAGASTVERDSHSEKKVQKSPQFTTYDRRTSNSGGPMQAPMSSLPEEESGAEELEHSKEKSESVAQDRPRRLAPTIRQGLGYSEHVLSALSSVEQDWGMSGSASYGFNASQSSGKLLMCTNPRCLSTDYATMTESQFRSYVSGLRTIGRPSWHQAYHNKWWYCFDCCPPFPTRHEASIANIDVDMSGYAPIMFLYGQGRGSVGSWEVLKSSELKTKNLKQPAKQNKSETKRGPATKKPRMKRAPPKNNTTKKEPGGTHTQGIPKQKYPADLLPPEEETGKDSAQCFLSHVQCFYQVVNKTEKYERLLQYLHKYQKGEYSVDMLVKRVRELLLDAPPSLLSEFRNFVPEDARYLVDDAISINNAERAKGNVSTQEVMSTQEPPSQVNAPDPEPSPPEEPTNTAPYGWSESMPPHHGTMNPVQSQQYWEAGMPVSQPFGGMPYPNTGYMMGGVGAPVNPMYNFWSSPYPHFPPWAPQYGFNPMMNPHMYPGVPFVSPEQMYQYQNYRGNRPPR